LLLKDIGQAATTPNSGYGSLYVNSNVLYFKTDGGTATSLLSGGGSGISFDGSTTDGVLTYKDSDEATVESNLTFNGSHLTIKAGVSFPKLTITTDSSGDQTYSAAEMVGGIIIRTQSSGFSDTTDTAANIVAAIPNAVVGSSFRLIVINKSTGTIALGKGTGLTFENGSTMPPPSVLSSFSISATNIYEFLVICTNVSGSSEAVTVYLINTYSS
jgi:hypothetical protein